MYIINWLLRLNLNTLNLHLEVSVYFTSANKLISFAHEFLHTVLGNFIYTYICLDMSYDILKQTLFLL